MTSSSLYLSRDLTLLRGDWERTQDGNAVRLHFVRGEKGLEIARERVVHGLDRHRPVDRERLNRERKYHGLAEREHRELAGIDAFGFSRHGRT